MKKSKTNRSVQSKVAKVMLAAMLLPAAAWQPTHSVSAATNLNDVKEMLNKLTPEQRRSLNEMKAETQFTIQPGINTTTSDLVHVIVEFKQEPAKVEQAKNPNQSPSPNQHSRRRNPFQTAKLKLSPRIRSAHKKRLLPGRNHLSSA